MIDCGDTLLYSIVTHNSHHLTIFESLHLQVPLVVDFFSDTVILLELEAFKLFFRRTMPVTRTRRRSRLQVRLCYYGSASELEDCELVKPSIGLQVTAASLAHWQSGTHTGSLLFKRLLLVYYCSTTVVVLVARVLVSESLV